MLLVFIGLSKGSTGLCICTEALDVDGIQMIRADSERRGEGKERERMHSAKAGPWAGYDRERVAEIFGQWIVRWRNDRTLFHFQILSHLFRVPSSLSPAATHKGLGGCGETPNVHKLPLTPDLYQRGVLSTRCTRGVGGRTDGGGALLLRPGKGQRSTVAVLTPFWGTETCL